MKRKTLYIAGLIVAALAVLYAGGKYVIYRTIHSALAAQADSLRAKGFEVSYSQLQTSAWSNSVTIDNLAIRFPGKECNDSSSRFTAEHLSISGIELWPVLFRKEVRVGLVNLEHPFYRNGGTATAGPREKNTPPKIKGIRIGRVVVTGAQLEAADSTCTVRQRGSFDFRGASVNISDPGTPHMRFSSGDAMLTNCKAEFPLQFYTLTVKQAAFLSADNSVTIDSISVIPWYDNITFARKTGLETDRIDARIPRLEITGLRSPLSGSDTVVVRRMALEFHAAIFRDKRQPDGKPKVKKLFARMIRDIRLPLQVDSVIISNSSVLYEEFPEKGTTAGVVTFEIGHAAIGNFSTFSPNEMTLKARAHFMKDGDLQAFFTFPANPDKPYSIKGSLTNFSMPRLNGMLTPAANAEIKKGYLQSLQFNFEYNDYRSDGQLTMNYTDLDIVSLVRNSDSKEENKFVTLILKSFIVKKDMDKNKSTGTILFYRDPSKASFNYWWKSILSGVKSLYNLDKVIDTHHSRKK